MDEKQEKLNAWVRLAVGLILLLLPIGIAIFSSTISEQAQLYLRIIAALGAAFIGSLIPGFLELKTPVWKAGGAIALFVLVYLFNPPSRIVEGAGTNGDPEASSVVKEVLNLVTTLRYIPETGLVNGSLVYSDREFRYGSIPGHLVGASYVQTPNGDKYQSDSLAVRLELTENATVYVAFDRRWSTLPRWLQSWRHTGESLVGGGTIRFDLYAKSFAAGPAILGSNRSPDNIGIRKENYGMYGLIVTGDAQ